MKNGECQLVAQFRELTRSEDYFRYPGYLMKPDWMTAVINPIVNKLIHYNVSDYIAAPNGGKRLVQLAKKMDITVGTAYHYQTHAYLVSAMAYRVFELVYTDIRGTLQSSQLPAGVKAIFSPAVTLLCLLAFYNTLTGSEPSPGPWSHFFLTGLSTVVYLVSSRVSGCLHKRGLHEIDLVVSTPRFSTCNFIARNAVSLVGNLGISMLIAACFSAQGSALMGIPGTALATSGQVFKCRNNTRNEYLDISRPTILDIPSPLNLFLIQCVWSLGKILVDSFVILFNMVGVVKNLRNPFSSISCAVRPVVVTNLMRINRLRNELGQGQQQQEKPAKPNIPKTRNLSVTPALSRGVGMDQFDSFVQVPSLANTAKKVRPKKSQSLPETAFTDVAIDAAPARQPSKVAFISIPDYPYSDLVRLLGKGMPYPNTWAVITYHPSPKEERGIFEQLRTTFNSGRVGLSESSCGIKKLGKDRAEIERYEVRPGGEEERLLGYLVTVPKPTKKTTRALTEAERRAQTAELEEQKREAIYAILNDLCGDARALSLLRQMQDCAEDGETVNLVNFDQILTHRQLNIEVKDKAPKRASKFNSSGSKWR